MLVCPMSALERVRALLAEAPGLERASDLAPVHLPVLGPLTTLLPGLRPGSTLSVTGPGATSLALALVARASTDAWTAVAGLPSISLVAACEFGVAIDRVVVIPETSIDVLAAVVDAFDLVVGRPPRAARDAQKLYARARERDAVLVFVGPTSEADLRVQTSSAEWHGIDNGHGYLRARKLTVTATGRGSAARPKRTSLWLPDPDGQVSVVAPVVPLDTRSRRLFKSMGTYNAEGRRTG
jgi:hypothetical protein